MKFTELGLAEPIVRAVAAEGYALPTPIQTKAIPPAVAGEDVLGCAQTGTGKTCAFALPVLHRLMQSQPPRPATNRNTPSQGNRNGNGNGRAPRALVLAPTRELASQIEESFRTYGKHLSLRHAVVFGGVNQFRQVKALRAGVDVLVATPGRLLDLMNQGYVDLRSIEILVLDEADRMLDMGFVNDIRKVVAQMPEERQTLFFSATMPTEIRRLADSMLRDPAFVKVEPVASTTEAVVQSVYMVTRGNKPALLERLLTRGDMKRTLIFSRTKHGADRIVKTLRRADIKADAIHGNKSQNNRTAVMDAFKAGNIRVLVATDIAARGIDVDEITHVVNFDLPDVAETYVHRIGRTARAGASGVAIAFCDHEEIGDLRAIERMIRKPLDVNTDEQDLTYKSAIFQPKSPQSANRGGQRVRKDDFVVSRNGGKSGGGGGLGGGDRSFGSGGVSSTGGGNRRRRNQTRSGNAAHPLSSIGGNNKERRRSTRPSSRG